MTVSINLDKDSLKYRPEDGKLYFTYQDIKSLPEWPDSPLIELSDGELFVVPSPSIKHQKISGNLFFLLKQILDESDLGELFSAPTDVKLTEENLVIPDILFVSNSRKNIITENLVDGVPDLIIEILSSNEKRDKEEKFELYETYGVKEYIIIDPNNEKISHFLLEKSIDNNKFIQQQFTEKNKITIITMDHAQIPIDEIFK